MSSTNSAGARGKGLYLHALVSCDNMPRWFGLHQQMIRTFGGECMVELPIPLPSWIREKPYELLTLIDVNQRGPVQRFELSMHIGTYNIANIPTNWDNLWLEVSGPLHPYQLTWRNMDLEGITPSNPIEIREHLDDAESASTESPNQAEETPHDKNFTAPVLLVRDGCYRK
ncbi:hypothetical protein CcaCcLH18_02080 [Colletotrichum camelliae]|nr:hypothetical protein CcaCcLH18_02080 [Colletotrichum camelliae]